MQVDTHFQIKLDTKIDGKLGLMIVRRHSARKTDVIDATKCPKPSKKRTRKCVLTPWPFTANVSGRDGSRVKFNLNDELEAFGVVFEMKNEYLIEIMFNMISTQGAPKGEGQASWKHWKLLLVPLPSMDTYITKHCLSLRAQLDIQVRHFTYNLNMYVRILTLFTYFRLWPKYGMRKKRKSRKNRKV